MKLSQETDEALRKATLAGRIQQDLSNGYALSADPELRAKELQSREFALVERYDQVDGIIAAAKKSP